MKCLETRWFEGTCAKSKGFRSMKSPENEIEKNIRSAVQINFESCDQREFYNNFHIQFPPISYPNYQLAEKNIGIGPKCIAETVEFQIGNEDLSHAFAELCCEIIEFLDSRQVVSDSWTKTFAEPLN